MNTQQDGEPTAPPRLAQVVNEVLAPSPTAVVVLALVAWRFAPPGANALAWVLVGALCAVALPTLYLVRQMRRGRVSDHHVRVRHQRPPIIVGFLAGGMLALALLARLGAPREVIALIGSGVVSATVALLITLRWKISVHVGTVAGVITVLVQLFGPTMLLLAPLVALVAWARVRVSDHTVEQVIGGAIVGAVSSGLSFALILRFLEKQ